MLMIEANRIFGPSCKDSICHRARTMKQTNLHPNSVLGKSLVLLDFEKVFDTSNGGGAWGKDSGLDVPQALNGFKFDGKALRHYEKIVLQNLFPRNWKGLDRIYFPAVFTGKIAKTFAEHGYDVFVSDLSPYWVKNAQELGLHAEVRSIEQIPPKSEFNSDIVVMFEPHIISNELKYFAFLRTLCRNIPLIMIDTTDYHTDQYDMRKISALTSLALRTDYVHEIKNPNDQNEPMIKFHTRDGKSYGRDKYYPVGPGVLRLGYDYGLGYYDHVVFYNPEFEHVFRFSCLFPNKGAVRRISLDLELLENYGKWAMDGTISITNLADKFKRNAGEISASLFRLLQYQFGYCSEKYQKLVCNIVE
ncbi:hypothetical protein KKF81_06430 [Candidatus Micrarchaeota archaeon]|nr:hypothetical protein [Candidatus Micrarchaeota archaeon]MBU1166565.1 hypothetical protein [Candidatus Micrarchaeota archaeon]MBU1887006.1 hypothetical protein [Candidatus Micrarchaeota archaeon]